MEVTHHEFETISTEYVVVWKGRKGILNTLQDGFTCQYKMYGKLREMDIPAMYYEPKLAWKGMQRLILKG